MEKTGFPSKIDVVLLTKNSVSHSLVFRKCLNTIYDEVPVHRLIVVDAFSDDGTIDVLKEYPNVEIHQIKGNRAVARQYGIEQVETDWFMFIDDDVILGKNWFKKALKNIDEKIGAIWGWDAIPTRQGWKAMAYVRDMDEYQLRKRNFKIRGGTHDILIRKEAIKDISIPSELHIFEDKFIKEYIEKQGFNVKVPREVYCKHYFEPSEPTAKWGIQLARLQQSTGAKPFHTLLMHFILGLPKSLVIFLVTRDFQEASREFKKYFYNFYGALFLRYKRLLHDLS